MVSLRFVPQAYSKLVDWEIFALFFEPFTRI